MLVAQGDALAGSSGLLLFLLGGGLFGAVISAYRFWVNFRTTERGMTRTRIQEAGRNERAAQHEAYLWQSRCADLEYLMRREGLSIPPLSEELRGLLSPQKSDASAVDWNILPPSAAGPGRPPT